MSLDYFTLFNPSLGPTEETLADQLLFYTSAATSDLDSQLRNIGLVQGIIALGKSFSSSSQQEEQPVQCIKSRDTRSYVLELEPGFWALLCLNIISDDGGQDLATPPLNQVSAQVRDAYEQFRLESGSLASVLSQGRTKASKVIEAWWLRWSWEYRPDYGDVLDLFDGFKVSPTSLTSQQQSNLDSFIAARRDDVAEGLVDVLVLHKGAFIHSGSDSTTKNDKKNLQRYVSRWMPVSQAVEPQRETDQHANSWLTAKKWSQESNRMINAIKSIQLPAPPTPSQEDAIVQSSTWWFKEDEKVLHVGQEASTTISLKVVRHGPVTVLFLLSPSTPAPLDDDDVVRELASCFEEAPSSSQPPAQPPPPPPPFFYSLVFDAATGSVTSTLPRLPESVLAETASERVVKTNTIHLHRQIHLLLLEPPHGELDKLVKTGRGVWVMVKRDAAGVVVLARSSVKGETMEDIDREARRWIEKVRRTSASRSL